MVERVGEWFAFTRERYCRRLTLYDTMAWPAHALPTHHADSACAGLVYAIAPFGGPVAVLRPPPANAVTSSSSSSRATTAAAPPRAVVVTSATDLLSDYIDVYTSAGAWRGCAVLDRVALGSVLALGWTYDGDVYALTSAHVYVRYRLEHMAMTRSPAAASATTAAVHTCRLSRVVTLHECYDTTQDDTKSKRDDDDDDDDDDDRVSRMTRVVAAASPSLPRIVTWCLSCSSVVYADAQGDIRGAVASGEEDGGVGVWCHGTASLLRLSSLRLPSPPSPLHATQTTATHARGGEGHAGAASVLAMEMVWPTYIRRNRRSATTATAATLGGGGDVRTRRVAGVYCACAVASAGSVVYLLHMCVQRRQQRQDGNTATRSGAGVRGCVRVPARVVAMSVYHDEYTRNAHDNDSAATATPSSLSLSSSTHVRVALVTNAAVLYILCGDLTSALFTLHLCGSPRNTQCSSSSSSSSNSSHHVCVTAAEDTTAAAAAAALLPSKLDWCTSAFVVLHYVRRTVSDGGSDGGGHSRASVYSPAPSAATATAAEPFSLLVCVLPYRIDVRCERVTWSAAHRNDDDDDDVGDAAVTTTDKDDMDNSTPLLLSTREVDGVRVLTRRACYVLQAVPPCLVRLCRLRPPWTAAAQFTRVWQRVQSSGDANNTSSGNNNNTNRHCNKGDDDDDDDDASAVAALMALYAARCAAPRRTVTATTAAAVANNNNNNSSRESAMRLASDLVDAAAYELHAKQQAMLLSAALAVYKLLPPELSRGHGVVTTTTTTVATAAAATAVSADMRQLSRRIDDVVRRARVLRALRSGERDGCHMPLTMQQYSVLTGSRDDWAVSQPTHNDDNDDNDDKVTSDANEDGSNDDSVAWQLPAQHYYATEADVLLGRLAYYGYYAQALDVATLASAATASSSLSLPSSSSITTLLSCWARAVVARSSAARRNGSTHRNNNNNNNNNNEDKSNKDDDDDAVYAAVCRVLRHVQPPQQACYLAAAHVAWQHGRHPLALRLALEHDAYTEKTLWLLLRTRDNALALLCAAASADADLLYMTLAVVVAQLSRTQQQQQPSSSSAATRDEVVRVLLASPVALTSLLYGAAVLTSWHDVVVRALQRADTAVRRRLTTLLAFQQLRNTLSRCSAHDMHTLQQRIVASTRTTTTTTTGVAAATDTSSRVLPAHAWADVTAAMQRAAQLQPRPQGRDSSSSGAAAHGTAIATHNAYKHGDDNDGDKGKTTTATTTTTVPWLRTASPSHHSSQQSTAASAASAAAVQLLCAPTTTPHDAAMWLQRHGDVATLRSRYAERYGDVRFARVASVLELLQLLYAHGAEEEATVLQRRYALSPSRCAHARLRALCEVARWRHVEQLLGPPPPPPHAVAAAASTTSSALSLLLQRVSGDVVNGSNSSTALVRAAASAAASAIGLQRSSSSSNDKKKSGRATATTALTSPCGVSYASAVQVLYSYRQYVLAARYVPGVSRDVAERCGWYVQLHAPRAALDDAFVHEQPELLQHVMQTCASDAEVQAVGQAYLQALLE